MHAPRHHLLITRFSWPHPSWDGKPKEEYENWLLERLSLFSEYTLKSLQNCYVKPTHWLILVNENHSSDFLASLTEMLNTYTGHWHIIPFPNLNLADTTKEFAKQFKYPSEILTTNLDADDLISSDFFAHFASLKFDQVKVKEGIGISYPGGSNYVPESKKFYLSTYPDNPFLTYAELVNDPSELKTVFFKMHTELLSFSPNELYLRSYYPMWSSVIHGGNLANNSLLETNRIELGNEDEIRKKFGIFQY